MSVNFSGFSSGPSAMTASGRVDWYDYYYSRTACSITTCASASDHSEALEGSSISVTFEYNGETYSDRIDVDASSGRDTASWSVTVTNGAGQRFTFTHW
ncbi:MAG: hypothetical protein M3265_09565 [Actinomycetota bacterium]|nr:hypothetical protein [Actinomycetota bacterium]